MGNKSIAIVASYCLGEEPVIRNRIKVFAEVLKARGWTTTIVAPSPTTPAGAALDRALPCTFSYVSQRQYDRRQFLVRGINEYLLARALARTVRTQKYDAILVTTPSMFLIMQTFRRKGLIYILDVRDLVWEYLPELGFLNRCVKMGLRKLIHRGLSIPDMVLVTNPEELKYLDSIPGVPTRMCVTNGISRAQFEAIRSIRYEARETSSIRVAYVGNVGLAQNLTVLVEAARKFPAAMFTIVGGGNDLPRVKAAISAGGATNISATGPMPWAEAVQQYGKSDVLYAQLSSSYVSAVPSKLYEYLATGLPVVYGGVGAAAKVLDEFDGVRVVPPDDPTSLVAAIAEVGSGMTGPLIGNVDRVRNEYIRETAVDRFVDALEGLVDAGLRGTNRVQCA